MIRRCDARAGDVTPAQGPRITHESSSIPRTVRRARRDAGVGAEQRSRIAGRQWSERRELYPQGVASGDPHPDSVMLWTRRPPAAGAAAKQPDGRSRTRSRVQARRRDVERAVVRRERLDLPRARGGPEARQRLLVSLHRRARSRQPHRPHADRAARERRAPRALRVRQLPERLSGRAERLSPHDLRGRAPRPAERQLDFVLHLGDFIYEIVWYPEDRPQGMYDRRLRDIVRFQTRREDARLPRADDARRLPRAVSRAICRIRICRTPARAGRSCASGTTTNSRGAAGRAS